MKRNIISTNHRLVYRLIFLLLIILTFFNSCRQDYFHTPPPAKVAKATVNLEAAFVNAAPSSISSSYWKNADYLKVNAKNISTARLYDDGLLNMTGTYGGITSFNGGKDPELTLKAAHDNEKIYILAEWTDVRMDLSFGSWLWNGFPDMLKTDSTNGWTSQRNSDKLAIAFEIDNASSSLGTFNTVGCAASCHNNSEMHPSIGKVDLWNWDLARTAPLGYSEDLIAKNDGLSSDGGQKIYDRNILNIGNNRSGPQYEWDGTSQNVTLPSGQSSLLDPAFYLKNKMPFVGDASAGYQIYHRTTTPGHCASCHGENGEGASEQAINNLSLNKKSRSALKQSMDNIGDMATYWGPLTDQEKDDIIAYLRGLSGVPGNYLNTPTGSNADITAIANVTPIQITNALLPVSNKHTKYQLLFIRNLKTGNTDDVDLTLSKSYKFGIALMDNDGKNHIGSLIETLTLK